MAHNAILINLFCGSDARPIIHVDDEVQSIIWNVKCVTWQTLAYWNAWGRAGLSPIFMFHFDGMEFIIGKYCREITHEPH